MKTRSVAFALFLALWFSTASAVDFERPFMLVSDLEKDELTRLAGIVSLPLAQRLADATSDRTKTIAWLFAPTPQELNSSPIH